MHQLEASWSNQVLDGEHLHQLEASWAKQVKKQPMTALRPWSVACDAYHHKFYDSKYKGWGLKFRARNGIRVSGSAASCLCELQSELGKGPRERASKRNGRWIDGTILLHWER